MPNLFEVSVYLRIVSPSEKEPGRFLILLDSNGEMPKISILPDIPINQQIREGLSKYFYSASQIETAYQTKNIADIQIRDSNIDIIYNCIAYDTRTKSGSFVNFNKNSIELYRLVSNHQS